MAGCLTELITACSNLTLSVSALYTAYQLFKDHRAPAVGFFLLGLSSGLCTLPLSFSPYLTSVQGDLEWAGEVLAPPLVSFGFLWLSEDRNTANILLIGSALLPVLCDWLSADELMLMSRCLALSAISCSLTVCLFAGNAVGALASVALSLPQMVAPRVGVKTLAPLVSPGATVGLLKWLLKGSMAVGCWASEKALSKYLLELKELDSPF
ncbi:transmembrane protein 276-like [Salvelinus alpinus]|uniref:transmembrane protein 276-like n=1 Tax=Salvelinus alpinus TaxID=8036 RepID=UPI0039FBA592